MSDFEIVDDFAKRAAELREMAAGASTFAAPLLFELARHYDEQIAAVRKRQTTH